MNSETNFVARRGVDLLRRADLHQLARAHDADAVAHHHRLFQAVGDVDEGLAGFPVDVLQLLLERLAQLVVDGRERLVEEQDVGFVGERPGERDALPLAAGTFRDVLAVIVLRQAQLVASAPARAPCALAGSTPLIFSENSMFSPTVRCGNSASDWNTMQVGRWLAGKSLMRSPRSRISPRGRRLHARRASAAASSCRCPTARRW